MRPVAPPCFYHLADQMAGVQVPEKMVAMAGMMIGVTVFAYIMSTVSSLLSTFNVRNTRSQERQQQLDSFCRTHKIPQPLARKLGQYYDRVLGKQVHREDLELVAGLSSSLRQQVRPVKPNVHLSHSGRRVG